MLLSVIFYTIVPTRKDRILEEHEDAVLGSQEDGQGLALPYTTPSTTTTNKAKGQQLCF